MSTKKTVSATKAGLIVCASVALLVSGLGQPAWCGEGVILDAGYYMQDFKPLATRLTIEEKGIRYMDEDKKEHMIPWKDVAEHQYMAKGRIGVNELLEEEYVFRFNVPKDGSDRWLHFTFEGSVIEAQKALAAMNRYYGAQGK